MVDEAESINDSLSALKGASPSIVFPLLIWLLVQFGALLIVAFRIPLWAKYPQPPDPLAIAILLVIQNVAAALLFPLLFRSVQCSIVIAATAWPMLIASAALASAPVRAVVPPGLYLMALFAVLCLWGQALRSRAASLTGTAFAATLVISPAVLEYLRLEFNPEATILQPLWHPTPIAASIGAIGGSISAGAWVVLAVIALPAVIQLLYTRRSGEEPQ